MERADDDPGYSLRIARQGGVPPFIIPRKTALNVPSVNTFSSSQPLPRDEACRDNFIHVDSWRNPRTHPLLAYFFGHVRRIVRQRRGMLISRFFFKDT